jgi:hypothetical protein
MEPFRPVVADQELLDLRDTPPRHPVARAGDRPLPGRRAGRSAGVVPVLGGVLRLAGVRESARRSRPVSDHHRRARDLLPPRPLSAG